MYYFFVLLLCITSTIYTNTQNNIDHNYKNYQEVITYFLTTDLINLNIQNVEGETILHRAVLNNDLSSIKKLVLKGINIHLLTKKKMSALLYALLTKHFDIANYLISKKARLKIHECHILQYAATKIPNGIDILLYYALYHPNPHPYIIEYLQKTMLNLKSHLQNSIKRTPLLIHYIDTASTESLNAQDRHGETLLYYAIRYKKPHIVALLLKKNVQVNTLNNEEKSPLYYALITKQFESASLLIEKNACLTNKEFYALHAACKQMKKEDAYDILLFFEFNHPVIDAEFFYTEKYFLPFNTQNISSQRKMTPLTTIPQILRNNRIIVYIICNTLETLNHQNKEGKTILHYSVLIQNNMATMLLIQRGVNLAILDNKGKSALYYSLITGQLEIAEALITAGARLTNKEYHLFRTDLKTLNDNDAEYILSFFEHYHPWLDAEFEEQYDFKRIKL